MRQETRLSQANRIFGIVGLISVFAGVAYLSSLSAALVSFMALVVYAFFGSVIVYAVRIIFRKKQPLFPIFTRIFLRFGSAVLISGIVVGSFCYYENEIEPAKIGIYPLSNGEKVVEFHSMAHIASDRFYNDTKEWIKAKKAQGYTLFYEGVRPGSALNEAKFDALLGFAFTPDLYKEFSKLYGLRQQDNHEFLGFSGAEDKNIDIGIDDIISLYEAKNGPIALSGSVTSSGIVSGSGVARAASGTITLTGAIAVPEKTASGILTSPSLESEIARFVEEIPPKQLALIRYFNRSVLNFLIKHKAFWLQESSVVAAPWLFDVILRERNKHLVSEILASPAKKIVILYGDLHFEGVFDLLQEKDAKWKTVPPIFWQEPMRP